MLNLNNILWYIKPFGRKIALGYKKQTHYPESVQCISFRNQHTCAHLILISARIHRSVNQIRSNNNLIKLIHNKQKLSFRNDHLVHFCIVVQRVSLVLFSSIQIRLKKELHRI